MKASINAIIISFLLLLAAPSCLASFSFEAIGELTPGEQYRQLSLLMLVSGGIDPELRSLLEPLAGRHPEIARDGRANLELDEFVTPLVRIVDPEILLANAAQMFRFAQENSSEIQARMTAIVQANPILISMVDVNAIAADAIIIRSSIADSIEYADTIDNPKKTGLLAQFRDQTVYLRNMMEYNMFQEELAELTNQAILDLGGRLDAYQRMFNEDVDPDLIRRRVESAAIMNEQTGSKYEDQAMARNTELLMMLILMESQVRH